MGRPKLDFESSAFNRSATSPGENNPSLSRLISGLIASVLFRVALVSVALKVTKTKAGDNGEWIALPVESEMNRRIAMFLVATLLKLGILFDRRSLKTEIAVSSTRVSVRVPDLVVFSEEGVAALEGASRSLVLLVGDFSSER